MAVLHIHSILFNPFPLMLNVYPHTNPGLVGICIYVSGGARKVFWGRSESEFPALITPLHKIKSVRISCKHQDV